jgi:hypothetical protein
VRTRTLLTAAVLAIAALCLTLASAFGAGGPLHLYLVNSGPQTTFYNESVPADGNCDSYLKPASLSTNRGTGAQFDSPGYAFGSSPHASTFSYSIPAGGGFTVPANPDSVILKLWSYSGDGSCDGQLDDQSVDWRVYCSGTCGSNVSLTGAGQGAPKAGWQSFDVPAGTPTNSLFNDHAGPSSAVTVGAGDVITLELSADTWAGIQWSAPNGAGASSLSIARR